MSMTEKAVIAERPVAVRERAPSGKPSWTFKKSNVR